MKNYVIPAVIIAFVGGAIYYTQKKKADTERAFLIDKINYGGDSEAAKANFKQIIQNMKANEVNVLYVVIKAFGGAQNAPSEWKNKFIAVSEKYNIFT